MTIMNDLEKYLQTITNEKHQMRLQRTKKPPFLRADSVEDKVFCPLNPRIKTLELSPLVVSIVLDI